MRHCVLLLFATILTAQPLPKVISRNGHWQLLVDGAPYIALAAQVNNSSAWPAILPEVWPAIHDIHANTVEMPVYWDQFEPQPNHFDFSVVDTLITQSRQHHVRLVLLWFGTWKNNGPAYEPTWMKLDLKRYFLVTNKAGQILDSPSPFATATLEADKHAFSTLMRHVREFDPQHTVILVQVENEVGTYGSLRDYGAAANEQFAKPVPHELLHALHIDKTGDWDAVFGENADEFFHAWAIARYVNQVVEAGKSEYALPMTINVALRDPFHPVRGAWESGGATDDVIGLWKATAPAIDIICPDIYMPDSERYLKELDLYTRPDNALFVPENGDKPGYSRYFFAALGHGVLGWAPFGIDYTDYTNAPLGAPKLDKQVLEPFAINYELVGPMVRQMAQLEFEGKVHAVVEKKDHPQDTFQVGDWPVAVSYGLGDFGFTKDPPGNPEPIGRAFVAQLSTDQFLVGGFFCRVEFPAHDSRYFSVEEGHYENGKFVVERNWNGDQTDYGLNFHSKPHLLRVTLSHY